MLSAANLVVTKGNTLLSDPEVEMACVLRVNRPFIHGVHAGELQLGVAAQKFTRTLIDEEKAELIELDE